MPAVIYYGKSSNRKNMSACREQIGDGVSLSTRDKAVNNYRRIDGKFTLNRPYNELIGLVEDSFYGERVAYIKNTSGGSWAAGILLETSTTLTSAGSCTAPNITAGVNQVVTLGTITGTIEAGSLTKWTDADSPNPVQYAICTAVGSGTDRTFDELPYDMTTPSVVVIPAIAAAAATNATAGEAKWVVTSAIANNGYAFVYGAAYVTGLDTSAYSAVGSKVYLGTSGASTPTASSTVTSTVQRVGQVVVKSATVGEIKYFPKERAIEKIASGGLQSLALANTHIFVGNGSGLATDVGVSGDVTLASSGTFTLASTIDKTVLTNRVTAQTAAATIINAFATASSDTSYEVSANVKITTSTAFSFALYLSYTNESSGAESVAMYFNAVATLSSTIANGNGAIQYQGIPFRIRCKANTTITVATVGTFTTVTYNAEARIQAVT